MPTGSADKWWRIGIELPLFLLLAVQAKLCPPALSAPAASSPDHSAAATVPAESAPAPASAATPATDKHASPAKKKIVLPYIVPDAAVPRWPAGWEHVAQRITIEQRDGVRISGLKDTPAKGADCPSLAPPPWRWVCDGRCPAWRIAPTVAPPAPPMHPALGTAITPQGPPVG